MLTTYRRHVKNCPHRTEGRKYRRCRCPIWVDGTLQGNEIRESLDTRNWEDAQERVRLKETGADKPADQPMTLANASQDFLADLKRRGLVSETIRKYDLLFRQMEAFAKEKGFRYLKEFDLPVLRDFSSSWQVGGNTAIKKLERLRSFFRYAVDSKWVIENPATKIKNPKIKQSPTLPYSHEEFTRILAACDQYKDNYGRTGQWNGRRLRSLTLLLRYSGLRIGDAVTLARDRIVDGKLFLYTAKTGTPVYCPLPDFAVLALEALEHSNDQYFFWSGKSVKSVTRDYQRYLRRLFHLAKVPHGHAHRFRDTFAVELLLAGVPLERVSILLGHSSVKVTEKHYSPWIHARQEQLEADVRRTWAADPTLFAQTKGTPQVHRNREAVN